MNDMGRSRKKERYRRKPDLNTQTTGVGRQKTSRQAQAVKTGVGDESAGKTGVGDASSSTAPDAKTASGRHALGSGDYRGQNPTPHVSSSAAPHVLAVPDA
ncbi:hypothetical protein Ancab_028603 [Ancistrocladus abbreviatus]